MQLLYRVMLKCCIMNHQFNYHFICSYEQLRGRCSNIPKLPVVKKKKVSIEKAVKTEHLLQSIFKDSNSNVTSDILSDEEVKSHAFPSMDTSANDNEGNNKKMSFLNSIQAIFAASNID